MVRRTWARLGLQIHGLRGVVLVIAALLAVLASTAPGLVALPALSEQHALPFWALLLLFAAVEVCVLHVQVRREAHSISLHEIPLVVGLFLASPLAVLGARLLGPLPVLLLVRKQAPVKVVFNEVLFVTDAAVALAVFRAFGVTDLHEELLVWLATFCAVTAAGTVAGTATTLVIAAYERRIEVRDLWEVPLEDAPRSMAVAVLGLISVYALSTDSGAALPLLAAAGVVLVAYRAYAGLNERHLSLERLYRFSQVVSSSPEVDEVLRSVMVQAKEMLHAQSAEISFLATGDGHKAVRVVLPPNGRLQRYELDDTSAQPAWSEVVDGERPVLVPRGDKDPTHQQLLRCLGYRDAVLAPLRGEAGVVGALVVADRLGDIRSFDVGDVRLLETVANHAGVALQNGRLIDQLRHEALHDALTGLPNRVLLQRDIAAALGSAAPDGPVSWAVGLMDLDGFKEINDTLGHQHGDQLLQEVARRLTDAAGDAAVARLGGDEFAFLFPVRQPDDAGAVSQVRRMLHALEQPIDLEGVDVEIGASVGLALFPEHARDVSGLLKRADVAMYEAKASGAGVRVYEASMDTSDPQRLALVGELRQALERGELAVHLQPKGHLRTGDITGVEALVRWQHPTLGLVPPDSFVPVAERSGLIRPLTLHVLRRSLEACAQWYEAGREVSVAVNLSARSLVDLDLVGDVAHLLRSHRVPARLLTLEITEGSVMTDTARAMGMLTALQDMGVRLSIDDFGTGYSSLSYLKRLPVHEVKIDRSFVTDMMSDVDDATIVRSIIDLAANLGLEVVAEGVEDQETWDRLTALGCAYAQGWHLSRPLPCEELLPWLDRYDEQRGRAAAGPRGAERLAG